MKQRYFFLLLYILTYSQTQRIYVPFYYNHLAKPKKQMLMIK